MSVRAGPGSGGIYPGRKECLTPHPPAHASSTRGAAGKDDDACGGQVQGQGRTHEHARRLQASGARAWKHMLIDPPLFWAKVMLGVEVPRQARMDQIPSPRIPP